MTAAERQLEQEMLDQPVCSLQYMLGRLSQKYGFLPQLAVSGNFDEQTLEAVMLFQRELFPAGKRRGEPGCVERHPQRVDRL